MSAETRARALLNSYLSPHQRRTLKTHGFFWTRGRNGNLYAILNEYSRVVCAYAKEASYWSWTLHHLWAEDETGRPLCDSDTMLTQLLLLRADPDRLHGEACQEYLHLDGNYLPQGPALARKACLPGFLAEEQRLAHPNQGKLA
jgi:hypothetical protein